MEDSEKDKLILMLFKKVQDLEAELSKERQKKEESRNVTISLSELKDLSRKVELSKESEDKVKEATELILKYAKAIQFI